MHFEVNLNNNVEAHLTCVCGSIINNFEGGFEGHVGNNLEGRLTYSLAVIWAPILKGIWHTV